MKYKFHIAALFDSSDSFSLAIFEHTQSRYVFSCSTLAVYVFFAILERRYEYEICAVVKP